MAVRMFGYFFGGALRDDEATLLAAFRANVHDVVTDFDHIEVVFDDQNRVAFVHQLLEYIQQQANILEV